jgi:hypothetical protein
VPVPKLPPGETGARQLTMIDPLAGARYADPAVARIAPYVDVAWYNGAYRDIAAAGMDPVQHYVTAGWREGRRPNLHFDPAWYIRRYRDIGDAGMEPLLHYVTDGFREGRQPVRPGDDMRAVFDATRRAVAHVPASMAPEGATVLGPLALRTLIAEAAAAAYGFVLAASHDRYIDVTGGIELVVGDEQRLFAMGRFAYLHVSPEIPRLSLADEGASPEMLQLVLNGRFVGLARASALREALAAEQPGLPKARLFVVHSFFGFRPSTLISLAGAVGAQTRLVWLHDFGALCEGFNLMRNGVGYCHAPAPDSHACMLCLHGARREAYQRDVRRLFAGLRPVLVAPSAAALAIFRAGSDLPHRAAVVQPNAVLAADPPRHTPRPHLGSARDPVRVAFAGYPMAHKGWPIYMRLVDLMASNPAFRMFHFAAAESLAPRHGLECVAVQVTADDRSAMVRTLREHRIDFVLVLSPWPETFSFVTYEAIAAGADVVTFGDSGNAAVAVRALGRGVVLEDDAALLAFFAGGAAIAYLRRAQLNDRPTGTMRLTGTSATLDPLRPTPPAQELPTTADPRLTVLAGRTQLKPAANGDWLAVTLPENTPDVRLLSRTDGDGIGVIVEGILLDGIPLALDDPRLGFGWLATAEGRATTGDAAIALPGTRVLELRIRPGRGYVLLPHDIG